MVRVPIFKEGAQWWLKNAEVRSYFRTARARWVELLVCRAGRLVARLLLGCGLSLQGIDVLVVKPRLFS